jgi:predicted Fe-Mo cluster-binding NifX family protein
MGLPLSIPWQRVACIQEAGISLLICGAISREYETMLQSCNVQVMPWIRGKVDEVIEAYLRGDLNDEGYCLPGRMRGRYRRRGGRGCRRGRIPGSRLNPEEE